MRYDNCPRCEVSLIGDPIPQEYIDKGYYGASTTHWRREIGHEVRGEYDGVLYWTCPDCGWAWNRWDFKGAPVGRMLAGENYVIDHNETILDAVAE